ncbi:hypothetical protein LJR289_000078 [Pseudoduganella sp. LjRoot289]|uniref:hypothetical protein n=1 Tax=Pseudoduganella sp. LjRoot289 TaxID=3342314 RepID=UPI003ED046FE
MVVCRDLGNQPGERIDEAIEAKTTAEQLKMKMKMKMKAESPSLQCQKIVPELLRLRETENQAKAIEK